MILHIKKHQATVSKWIDGSQGESCNKSSKKGSPESLQGKVITDLRDHIEKKSITGAFVTMRHRIIITGKQCHLQ